MTPLVLMFLQNGELAPCPTPCMRTNVQYIPSRQPGSQFPSCTTREFSFLLLALCFLKTCPLGSGLLNVTFDSHVNSHDTECVKAIKETFRGALNMEMWALTMLDSSGRFDTGMQIGRMFYFGEPDSCWGVTHPSGSFIGNQCLFEVNFTVVTSMMDIGQAYNGRPVSLYLQDLCVPSVCSGYEIAQLFLNTKIGNFSMSSIFEGAASEPNACVTRLHKIPFDVFDCAFLFFFGFIFLAMIFGTVYECHYKYNRNTETPNEYLCAFSLYKNGKKLFVVPDMDKFGIIHFLKATSMFGIVFGHSAMDSLTHNIINKAEMLNKITEQKFVLYNNAHNICDTFFVIGAMLLVVSFYKEIKAKGSYDFPLALVKRYFRLTPVCSVVVAYIISLRRHISVIGGPRSTPTVLEENCRRRWPYILLYIHNYLGLTNTCFMEAWYLDVDMQLFLLSPLLLYPVLKFRWWAALSLIGALIAASVEFAAGIKYDLGPVVTYSRHVIHPHKLHFVTHLRAAPYLFGIFLGFFYAKVLAEGDKFKLSKRTNVAVWVLVGVPFMLSQIVLFFFDFGYTQPAAAFALSYRRLFWSAGIAWMIAACTTGHGGFMHRISTWKPWYFFSMISFCVYVTHLTVMDSYATGIADSQHASATHIFFCFLQFTVISVLVGTLLTITVELPFANVFFLVFKNAKIFPYPRPPKKSIEVMTSNCEQPVPENVTENSKV